MITGQTRSLEAEVRDNADLQPCDRQAGAALASPLALPPSCLFSVSLLLRGLEQAFFKPWLLANFTRALASIFYRAEALLCILQRTHVNFTRTNVHFSRQKCAFYKTKNVHFTKQKYLFFNTKTAFYKAKQ